MFSYIKESFGQFTRLDWGIWIGSVIALLVTFSFSGGGFLLTLIASVIGVTSLIFLAKGNVIAHFLVIIFAIFYAIVSYSFHYYGEMITYLGMTAPSALAAAIAWIRNPYSHTEVKVGEMTKAKWAILLCLTALATVVFYFLLGALNTANLKISTFSVTTSFLASGLMFLRSPYYAPAYMANDFVLVIMWLMASKDDLSYLPMAANFLIFFFNDLYGFISWRRMQTRQG